MSFDEIWLPIVEFPEYEVSNRGRVRRVAAGRGTQPGRIRRQKTCSKGYKRVAFQPGGKNSPQRIPAVHRLVLTAFDRPPNDTEEANHKDGDKSNNHIENLEWLTPKANMQHAAATGLRPSFAGELNGRSRLTRADVIAIRIDKRPYAVIAQHYGVSRSLVGMVRRFEIWRSVQAEGDCHEGVRS